MQVMTMSVEGVMWMMGWVKLMTIMGTMTVRDHPDTMSTKWGGEGGSSGAEDDQEGGCESGNEDSRDGLHDFPEGQDEDEADD